jgi:hydroxymethylglutaryl-CoA lyase
VRSAPFSIHAGVESMKSTLPDKAVLHEVVLRDGIQNEKKIVSTEEKLRLIDRLVASGVWRIEVSSFVNPRLVPQMADAEELWQRIDRKKGVVYSALILSERGLDRAMACGVPHVGIFVSASETHSRKNSNKSIAEALEEALTLILKARSSGIKVRTGVMNAFGCAYEGRVPPSQVLKLVGRLFDEGPDEICLADTSGLGNPRQMKEMINCVRKITGKTTISLHLHNTRGQGMANLWAAMEEGVAIFDTSLGGLGGCPFISGARGNIATEDTVSMLHDAGIRTGIDLGKLIDVSQGFEKHMGLVFPAAVSHLTGAYSR